MAEIAGSSQIVEALPFGLQQPPFADEPPAAGFFPSDQHLRATDFIGHALWSRTSFAVLIGERGCGKTLLVRNFFAQLDDRVLRVHIDKEGWSPEDFLREILDQLGIRLEAGDRTDRRRLLERFLMHQTSFKRICLLVVENAQTLPVRTLETLRQLALLEADGMRVLKVLLVGEPSLAKIVESPRMSALGGSEAIPCFVLSPLSEDQTAAYISQRLHAVHAAKPDALIPPGLMSDIYHASGGIPALVNDICSRALAYAAAAELAAVNHEVLRQAITSLQLQPWRTSLEAPHHEATESHVTVEDTEIVITVAMQGESLRELVFKSDRILIGRSELADVRIDSAYVSRYHALIIREHGRDLLIDLGSTNVVLVNSKRVTRYILQLDDLIQIGSTRLGYYSRPRASAQGVDTGATVSMMAPTLADADGESDGILISFAALSTASSKD